MIDLHLYHAITQGQSAWCELNLQHTALIHGPDSLRYLNGQITNDIKTLPPGKSILAAVLNTKGKFISELWVKLTPNQQFLIDAPHTTFPTLKHRLEMYIIADDVTIQPTPHLKGYYLFGTSPPHTSHAPIYQSSRWKIPGWEIWSPSPIDLSPIPQLPHSIIETLRIENGVPQWGVDFDQTYLPQEAAWDEHYGLHFAKGCYLGQEIVSRLRNVGKVNRQIKILRCTNASPQEDLAPLLGQTLTHDHQPIAHITSITYSPRFHSWIALATIPRSLWHQTLATPHHTWQCLPHPPPPNPIPLSPLHPSTATPPHPKSSPTP